MVELGVPDALDWDWGTTDPPQHQNGEHLPSHCLALGSWEAPAWTGAFLTTRGEALHPRQVQNPCPAMRTPQDDRNQQGLPHRPAPQAWGGQRGPSVPLHPWVLSPASSRVVMAARRAGVAPPVCHPPPVTQDGVILDTAPSGGFQSHRGAVSLPFPHPAASSWCSKRGKGQTGS